MTIGGDFEGAAVRVGYCPGSIGAVARDRGLAMTWAVRQYSANEVDAAGAALVRWARKVSKKQPSLDDEQFLNLFLENEHALAVINNWRSSHSFPLNTFQVGLRRMSKKVDSETLVAQRIKRLSSIESKLVRLRNLTLSEMQDIGGCRAVVKSVPKARELVAIYKESDIKHRLDDEDDYIAQPKVSGYRGYHLIYRYNSDKNTTYNGLKIEVQIRSPLQHAWATAVETVGTFIRQALKSSQGEREWLRFFALMGTAMAIREETPPVPNTPTSRTELVRQLRQHARSLQVEAKLRAYGNALQTLEKPSELKNSHYFLLALNPAAGTVTVTGYKFREVEKASNEYLATERAISQITGAEAVLVSVESLAQLRRAYPNYFLDTTLFIIALREALATKAA